MPPQKTDVFRKLVVRIDKSLKLMVLAPKNNDLGMPLNGCQSTNRDRC